MMVPYPALFFATGVFSFLFGFAVGWIGRAE